jgi:hypothetical protein
MAKPVPSCTRSGWIEAASECIPSLVLSTNLPDGAVIAADGEAYTIVRGLAFRWSERGYEPVRRIPLPDELLTPPSTVLAIRAGYRPMLHPDIEATFRF